jgi:hypothetical protein
MAAPVTLLLCEYATIHVDGTCTIVRGGIETWTAKLPLSLALILFVEVGANALPAGEHDVAVEFLSPQGFALSGARVKLAIGRPEFAARFIVPLSGSVQAFGKCVARVQIGSLPVAEVGVIVQPEGN